MKKVTSYSFFDKGDWYDLTYRITEHCTHGCRYCDFYDNTQDSMTECWEEVGNFIKKELQGRKVRLYIYGGEPTTHPDLMKIIDHLSPLVTTIGIQTNLYGDISLIRQLIEVSNVYILPTFHIEREKDHKTFLKKVLLVEMKRKLWELNFLLPLKNFDQNYQVFLDFEKILKGRVVPQPLIGEEDEWLKKKILNRYLESKDEEMYRHFEDGSAEGISMSEWRENREDYVTGWSCSAGLDTIYIEWNGEIFQCLNDMYLHGDSIGNVRSPEGYLSNLKKTCPYEHCQFSTHISIKRNE